MPVKSHAANISVADTKVIFSVRALRCAAGGILENLPAGHKVYFRVYLREVYLRKTESISANELCIPQINFPVFFPQRDLLLIDCEYAE